MIPALILFGGMLAEPLCGQNDAGRLMREWAAINAAPLAETNEDAPVGADLRQLQEAIGSAKVIAFGEPVHGAHEPLAARNRFIRYAVAELGVTAIGLETGIGTAKVLYDYVLGAPDPGEPALRNAFSYGFGDLSENLQLLRWIRVWNASRPANRKVRLYGYDLSGQLFPYAYHSVEAALSFIERADPKLGAVLRSDDAELVANLRADRYLTLNQQGRDALTRRIQDLIATIKRERDVLVAGGSLDDYDWALQEAIAAAQDDDYLRALPGNGLELFTAPRAQKRDVRWEHAFEMREIAMAQNVEWIQHRTEGRTLIFAHVLHLQKVAHDITGADAYRFPIVTFRSCGYYLKARYSGEYVVIASLYGRGEGFKPDEVPLPGDEIARVFSAATLDRYVVDLRKLPQRGALRAWFDAQQPVPTTLGLQLYDKLALASAFDAIVWLGVVTPSRPEQ
jgi:erythromycin esterase